MPCADTKIDFTPPPKPTEFSEEDMAETRRLRAAIRRDRKVVGFPETIAWIFEMATKYADGAYHAAHILLNAEDEALQKQITSK